MASRVARQTASKVGLSGKEASARSDEQVEAKRTSREADPFAKSTPEHPENSTGPSKTKAVGSSTNDDADREKANLEKFEKACQDLAIVARHPRPTPAWAATEKNWRSETAGARSNPPPLKTEEARQRPAPVVGTKPRMRPWPRLNPAAKEFKSEDSKSGATEAKSEEATASDALRWLLGGKTCHNEDDLFKRAVEVFGDLIERRLKKREEERQINGLQLMSGTTYFPYMPQTAATDIAPVQPPPPPTFQPVTPGPHLKGFPSGPPPPPQSHMMFDPFYHQMPDPFGAAMAARFDPHGPVGPRCPPQHRPANGWPPAVLPPPKMPPVHTATRLALPVSAPHPPSVAPSTALPMLVTPAERTTPSRTPPSKTTEDASALRDTSKEQAAPSKDSDESTHSKGSLGPHSNDEGASSKQTPPDMAPPAVNPTVAPPKLAPTAPERTDATTPNGVANAPPPDTTQKSTETGYLLLPPAVPARTHKHHAPYPQAMPMATPYHMEEPVYMGGPIHVGGPVHMGPNMSMPPAVMRSAHHPFPCEVSVFPPAPATAGPPLPVPKPKIPNAQEQQMYEQWIEWRKANEPGYAQECKLRQARRSQRSKVMSMSQHKSSHRSESSTGGAQN
jgi:hypothetical protein